MKYIIKRASDWNSMPCRDCVYETVSEIMKCRGEQPMEWLTRSCIDVHKEGDLWVGTRKEPIKAWTKEIDDLTEFVDKYGKIILEHSDYIEVCYKIIIYDDYI